MFITKSQLHNTGYKTNSNLDRFLHDAIIKQELDKRLALHLLNNCTTGLIAFIKCDLT